MLCILHDWLPSNYDGSISGHILSIEGRKILPGCFRDVSWNKSVRKFAVGVSEKANIA